MLKIRKYKVSFPTGITLQYQFILDKVVIGSVYVKPHQEEEFLKSLQKDLDIEEINEVTRD